jgi:hypothetical protein
MLLVHSPSPSGTFATPRLWLWLSQAGLYAVDFELLCIFFDPTMHFAVPQLIFYALYDIE